MKVGSHAMPSASELDTKYRIGDLVRITQRDGHIVLAIRTTVASAEIALQGAQVLSWSPNGNNDVLWCAPLPPAHSGKAIRGGIPICWPWFGPHATDPSQPQHGMVRTANWTLAATHATANGAQIVFTHDAFGCALRVELKIGRQLTLSLSATNQSVAPVTITEALHTYFSVSDARTIKVYGLDGLTYRDNADGAREKQHLGEITPSQETIAVFPNTPDVVELRDQGFHRGIRITRGGGRSTIVWHPGASVSTFKDIQPTEATRFICVESGNVMPHAVTIAPGGTHRLAVTYDVTTLK